MRKLAWLVVVAGCGHVLDTPPMVDADPCTGVCECRLDTDCAGDHTACDDETTSRTCVCAAGYTKGVTGACEWSGVVTDPGFQAPSMWNTGTDGAVDPNLNVTGMVEPGAAEFHVNGLCNMARISQTITMPKYSRAEPLVAQISYRFRAPSDFFGAPALGIGPSWHDDLPSSSNNFTTARFCLGGAAYAPESITKPGAPLPLVVMPAQLAANCTDVNTFLDIDHLEIFPANPGECGVPGIVTNGDFEGAGGWTFSAFGVNGTQATADFAAGAGEGGTRGGKLFFTNRCSSASLAANLSIPAPDQVASPALSYFIRTPTVDPQPANDHLSVSFANIALPATITPVGATTKLCLPAFARGGVFQWFSSYGIDGLCADILNFESDYDNVKLVNDPSCGTDSAVTDPGFESTANTLFGSFAVVGASIARAANDPANAHSGTGVLQLSVTSTCNDPSYIANVVTPPASGTAGPALTFFYKAPAPVKYKLTVVPPSGTPLALTLDNTYHQGIACLDPKLVGRNQRVSFALSFFMGGSCNVAIPAEQAFIDDLAVTTDPSCPAN